MQNHGTSSFSQQSIYLHHLLFLHLCLVEMIQVGCLLFVARHTRRDGIIWKFCYGVCNLSWDLYRSRLTFNILLMTGGTKSISKGFGLLTPPSLPLSLGLGPCHLCRPKKADREATL